MTRTPLHSLQFCTTSVPDSNILLSAFHRMSCYRCERNSRTASRVLSVWDMILLTVARYEIATATDRKDTDVAVCSADRNSYYSPSLALPLFPVAHSKGSSGVSHPLHPLHLSKENRQFGSKMTDSKYFTTTKKGMIHHTSIFFLLKKICR